MKFGISKDPADFKFLGMKEGNQPEVWEDGMRTDGGKGTYEWWYFDAHLDDGATVVVTFFPKPMAPLNKPLTPHIDLEYDHPDGTSYKKQLFFDEDEFSASKDKCDVRMGDNYFRGDLKNYQIYIKDENIELDLLIKAETESWRADTGHQFFDEEKKIFGAWLVAVPQGQVKAKIILNNQDKSNQGSCYHDHNWGTVDMLSVRNHWYWARAEMGPYTVVLADMVGEKEFNYASTVNFYLAKDGKTIADDRDKVEVYRSNPTIQKDFGKPVSDNLKFIYDTNKADRQYVFTFKKDHNISALDVLEKAIKNKLIRKMAQWYLGKESAYYRMIGEVTMEVFEKGNLIEEYKSDKAIWECMYFGNPIGTE